MQSSHLRWIFIFLKLIRIRRIRINSHSFLLLHCFPLWNFVPTEVTFLYFAFLARPQRKCHALLGNNNNNKKQTNVGIQFFDPIQLTCPTVGNLCIGGRSYPTTPSCLPWFNQRVSTEPYILVNNDIHVQLIFGVDGYFSKPDTTKPRSWPDDE